MYCQILKKVFLFVNVPFLFLYCAHIVHPTGGLKNTTPPILISSDPVSGSLNFNKKSVNLEFDQAIAIKDLQGISLKALNNVGVIDFEVIANGKILTIRFKEPLVKDDFYTVSCIDAICDINEGNVLSNINVSFSTGELKGENCISGNVIDTKTNQPKEQTYVLLYRIDSLKTEKTEPHSYDVFINKDPNFISKTDAKGNFNFENILDGDYKIYVSSNKLLLGNTTSDIGIYPGIIRANNKTSNNAIQIFTTKFDTRKMVILKQIVTKNHLFIETNKPIEAIVLDNDDPISYSLFDNGSVACVYLNSSNADLNRDKIGLKLFDENRNVLKTEFNFNEKTTFDEKQLRLEFTPVPDKILPSKGELYLIASKPIKNILTDSLDWCKFVLKDNSIVLIKDAHLSYDKKKIVISYDFQDFKFKDDKPIELDLVIDNASITDLDDNYNEELKFELAIKSFKDYGSVLGSVKYDANYKLELINIDSGKIYEKESKDFQNQEYAFKYIEPGRYLLRAFLFKKNFSYWSPGNIELDATTDAILLYPNIINVLANWENEFINFE